MNMNAGCTGANCRFTGLTFLRWSRSGGMIALRASIVRLYEIAPRSEVPEGSLDCACRVCCIYVGRVVIPESRVWDSQ
jgi:hypothetical protein